MDTIDDQNDYSGSDEEIQPALENVRANAKPCSINLEVPFNSQREAEIARTTLIVDAEPKRSNTKKTLTVKNNVLHIEILSPDVRQLRIAINAFMDLLHLTCKTIDQFGPPVPQSKKLCT